jgi:hypothetical protein
VLTPTGAFRPWPVVGMLIAGVGLALGFTIMYVANVDRDAERRNIQRVREICGLIQIVDDRNQHLPPATDPETVQFRAELHRYRQAIGC